MAKTVTSLRLAWRRRWLGETFIWIAMLPVLFGWRPSNSAAGRLASIALRLMGPKVVVA